MVVFSGFLISTFFLHFMQYASVILFYFFTFLYMLLFVFKNKKNFCFAKIFMYY